MTRLLMLSYEFPPLGGGLGNACFHVLEEFSKEPPLQVDLITSGCGERLERSSLAETIEVYRLPIRKRRRDYWTASEIWQWSRAAYRLARRLSRDGSYDLCHCWSGWPAGVIGYLLRRRQPYLAALRGSDVPGFNERLGFLDPLVFRPLSRVVWKRAAAVTAVSRSLKRLAERTAPDVRIRVIENGVDTAQFSPNGGSDRFTVLYVGRLVPRKGVRYLLEAFAQVLADHPTARLVIAGEGPERVGLEALGTELDLGDRVSFRGHVEHAELPDLYRQASVFVLPALQEGMSNALLEAMASEVPTITTEGTMGQLPQDCGTIVAARSAAQLAAAIGSYLRDPGLRARHGASSLAFARSRSWGRKAKAYLELYHELLD